MSGRERGKFYIDNPILGTSGTQLSKLSFGSACLRAASMLGDGETTASVAVTNAAIGDKVIIMPAASLGTGVVLYNASAIAGYITASFLNSGSAAVSASSDITVSYIIFS
jgi:hypothetical protein